MESEVIMMPPTSERICPICKTPDQPSGEDPNRLQATFKCERCGEFAWSNTMFSPIDRESKVSLSGYSRDQNTMGLVPEFTIELVQAIVARQPPRLTDRARRLLSFIVKQNGLEAAFRPGSYHVDPACEAVSYSRSFDEVELLAKILFEASLLAPAGTNRAFTVTPKGFIEAEEGSNPRSASHQGFIAMSFDPAMLPTYTFGFEPGLRAVGYSALRIDNKEHSDSISDQILAEIRRSRFLVADYTQQNNGVYYEAGFALGLGIRVIPTCRADAISKLHFDIRHINTVPWDNPADLAVKLAQRVSAVVGDGPLPRPPGVPPQ